jgi:GntR family transcriptional regulator
MVYDMSPMQARATLVERVTEQIAFRIASGTYPPGEKMPSVRALARELGINPSTVQVILGRLQETGFVEVNPGVGFVVRESTSSAGSRRGATCSASPSSSPTAPPAC